MSGIAHRVKRRRLMVPTPAAKKAAKKAAKAAELLCIDKNTATALLENSERIGGMYFSYKRISDEGAWIIASILETNTEVEIVDLCRATISTNGIRIIAAALENNTTVTKVDFSRQNISNEGAQAIAAMFEKNVTMTDLNFDWSHFGAEGLRTIEAALENNTTITRFSLCGTLTELHGVVNDHWGLDRDNHLLIAALTKRNRRVQFFLRAAPPLGLPSIPRFLRFARGDLATGLAIRAPEPSEQESKDDSEDDSEDDFEDDSEDELVNALDQNPLFTLDVSRLILSYVDGDFIYRSGSGGRIIEC